MTQSRASLTKVSAANIPQAVNLQTVRDRILQKSRKQVELFSTFVGETLVWGRWAIILNK